MKAAVTYDFERPPRYGEFADPEPRETEELIDVRAAGLHQIVRARAGGRHYSSPDDLPTIPGVDGVGRRNDGTLVYFGGLRDPYGTFAEQAAAPASFLFPLPDGVDPAVVAASMNPGMSGWMALTARAELQLGESVVILGATGASGRLATRAARLLGAGRVTAVGRSRSSLETLSDAADRLVSIDESDWPASVATDGPVDIVIDYLGGEPAARTLRALVAAGSDPARRLTWVLVGSMAGEVLPLPSAALRSHNVQICGSGMGSLTMQQLAGQLPAFAGHVIAGRLAVTPAVRALADVTGAWSETVASGERIVFVP